MARLVPVEPDAATPQTLTENAMNEQIASQMQHAQEMWKRTMDESYARVAAGFEEMGKLEAKALEQSQVALNDFVRIQQESLAYAAKLATEWRKQSLDAFKKSAELLTPKA